MKFIDRLLDALSDGNRENVEAMLDAMGEKEKVYMLGYLNGYVDALNAVADAEKDMTGFNNPDDSDRMSL